MHSSFYIPQTNSNECSHISKRSGQVNSLCRRIYTTDVGLVVSVRCVIKYGPALIAQSSTNQLALFPGSPEQTSNSGDKVRFVLGKVLPDRTVEWYTVLHMCKSKNISLKPVRS